MCMYKIKGKIKEKGKTLIKVKKVLRYDGIQDKFFAPSMGNEVEAGWYKAGEADTSDSDYSVGAGIIHAYKGTKTSNSIGNIWNLEKQKSSGNAVLTCHAYAEDFVLFGEENQIGFKKIFVPLSEMDRVRKTMKSKKK